MSLVVEPLSILHQVPNLDKVRIDPKWALKLPSSYAIRKRVIPLSLVDNQVAVACLDPNDAAVKKTVEKYLDHKCHLIAVEADALSRLLGRVYESIANPDQRSPKASTNGVAANDDAVAICDEIFQAAMLRQASDIHLVPTERALAIHLRVDGVLELYRELAKTIQPLVTNRIKVLAGMDIAEKRSAQDGRITTCFGQSKRRLEIRAAALPTRFGERITLRLLANNAEGLSLQSLGMSDQDLRLFKSASAKPHGLVLLTGPTGSGKSTTLFVALQHLLKSRGGNVITIEDPIEYEIEGASQVEVDSADKVNFSKALRSVLRHDPDVVMIGEIRDEETANTAIKAALTGHLVFSTLHTNNSAGVVSRLIDMGVEPFLVAATLRLAVAQRLVRKLCPDCRRERRITAEESLLLCQPSLEGQRTFDPLGCLSCAGTGYSGRIGLFEMFESNSEIAKLIASNSTEASLATEARRLGYRALIDDGLAKLLDGTTTVAEIASAISWELQHDRL